MNKRLSTSTNLMDRYLKTQGVITMTQCIDECYKAGYRILDMNLCDMSNPGMPLSLDNWEQWVDNVGNQAARLGIELTQSHSAFYNVVKRDVEDRDFREEMVRRSIIASSRFGVKWMVMHAGTVREEGYSWAESKKKNIAYFAKHLEMGKKYGVGIAIENLFDPKHDPRTGQQRDLRTMDHSYGRTARHHQGKPACHPVAPVHHTGQKTCQQKAGEETTVPKIHDALNGHGILGKCCGGYVFHGCPCRLHGRADERLHVLEQNGHQG